MGAMEDEKSPLVAPTVPTGLPRAQAYGPVATTLPERERNWSGRLFQFDSGPDGCANCVYVAACSPFAWGHNLERALNVKVWKYIICAVLLIFAWAHVQQLLDDNTRSVCDRQPLFDTRPGKQHDGVPTDFSQTFLAGATFQPEKFEPLAESKPDLVSSDPQTPVSQTTAADEDEISTTSLQHIKAVAAPEGASVRVDAVATSGSVSDQILATKQQVAEGMAQLNAQLGVGRKMLHEHKGHDDKHKKGKKAKKEAKKAAKKEAKKAKKELKEWQKKGHDHAAPWEEHHLMDLDAPFQDPECLGAQRRMCAFNIGSACAAVALCLGFVAYAAKMRTTMRERFGIPGSALKDFFTWLCCGLCALCQETRTLTTNNVRAGIWFGPTRLAAPTTHPLQAPSLQTAEEAEPVKAAKLAADV